MHDARQGVRGWIEKGASFSGNERNRLFLQTSSGLTSNFADVSLMSGVDSAADGRAFAEMDFDWDGDVDMVVVNANAPLLQLFENLSGSNEGNALWIDVQGAASTKAGSNTPSSNRDGVGARVVVQYGGVSLSAEKRAGEGFAAQNTGWLHFGLGSQTEVDQVTVYWPSGQKTQIQGPIELGQRLRVYESSEDSPTDSNLERID